MLVSDFCESAPPQRLLGATKRLHEAGVNLIGLAALASLSAAATAERLAAHGMEIAALTPKELATWLVKAMS